MPGKGLCIAGTSILSQDYTTATIVLILVTPIDNSETVSSKSRACMRHRLRSRSRGKRCGLASFLSILAYTWTSNRPQYGRTNAEQRLEDVVIVPCCSTNWTSAQNKTTRNRWKKIMNPTSPAAIEEISTPPAAASLMSPISWSRCSAALTRLIQNLVRC